MSLELDSEVKRLVFYSFHYSIDMFFIVFCLIACFMSALSVSQFLILIRCECSMVVGLIE